jgi:hypothetical protein
MRPFHNRRCDGLSFLPRHLIGWTDVIVVRAWPPFAVTKALHSLDGEKTEVANMPLITLGVGSRPSL